MKEKKIHANETQTQSSKVTSIFPKIFDKARTHNIDTSTHNISPTHRKKNLFLKRASWKFNTNVFQLKMRGNPFHLKREWYSLCDTILHYSHSRHALIPNFSSYITFQYVYLFLNEIPHRIQETKNLLTVSFSFSYFLPFIDLLFKK